MGAVAALSIWSSVKINGIAAGWVDLRASKDILNNGRENMKGIAHARGRKG